MKDLIPICIALASVPGCLLGSDAVSVERLPVPEKTVAVSWNFGDQPTPRWQQGMLLGHGAEDGDVVVVGRGGQMKMHAKAWLDGGGRVMKYVTLNPAAAVGVAFAPDGTLWALVRVHDDSFNELRDYDMLRHYSAGGRLLGAALARGSFAYGGTYPAWSPCLTVTTDRVGFLSNRTNEWIEVSPENGKLLLRWRLPSTLRAHRVGIDSVAMTPDEAVYFNTSKRALRPGEKQEFGVYRLDRNTGVASQVDFSAVPSGDGWLSILGGEDGRLVAGENFERLSWIPVR